MIPAYKQSMIKPVFIVSPLISDFKPLLNPLTFVIKGKSNNLMNYEKHIRFMLAKLASFPANSSFNP